jgi:hypothetical protein
MSHIYARAEMLPPRAVDKLQKNEPSRSRSPMKLGARAKT